LEKRKRLEEAQPRHHTVPIIISPQSDSSHYSDTITPVVEISNHDWEADVTAYPVDAVVAHPVVPQLNAANAMKHRFQGLFLESYFPADPKEGPSLYREWLCEAVSLNRPDKVLEFSLHALCITRAGRDGNNPVLVFHGKAAYGYALRELQKALLSPAAFKDETLAACYLLSIYEVYHFTKLQRHSLNIHSYSNRPPNLSLLMKIIC
jgi:hypothetical protein